MVRHLSLAHCCRICTIALLSFADFAFVAFHLGFLSTTCALVGRHQDSTAAPVDTDKLLTIWLSLDEWGASANTGALVFATGSHKSSSRPSLRKLPLQQRVASVTHLTDEDIAADWKLAGVDAVPVPAFSLLPEETVRAINGNSNGELDAGDASIHLGWTFHRAVCKHIPSIFHTMKSIHYIHTI